MICRSAVLFMLTFWCGGFILSAQIHLRNPDLPVAIIGAPYNVRLEVYANPRCTLPDIWFSADPASLPPGIELSLDGLRGTPKLTGTFPIVLRAQNGCSQTEKRYNLVVAGRPILAATPAELKFRFKKAGAKPTPQSFAVRADWSSQPFDITLNGGTWLRAVPMTGMTPPEGLAFSGDPVNVSVDPEGLEPGTYMATITISSRHSANKPVVSVTL